MPASGRLRIGTRASKLARWQSDWVAARLRERGVPVEIVEIATSVDIQQAGPVAAIGGQGNDAAPLDRAAARLGELPGDPRNVDHRLRQVCAELVEQEADRSHRRALRLRARGAVGLPPA